MTLLYLIVLPMPVADQKGKSRTKCNFCNLFPVFVFILDQVFAYPSTLITTL